MSAPKSNKADERKKTAVKAAVEHLAFQMEFRRMEEELVKKSKARSSGPDSKHLYAQTSAEGLDWPTLPSVEMLSSTLPAAGKLDLTLRAASKRTPATNDAPRSVGALWIDGIERQLLADPTARRFFVELSGTPRSLSLAMGAYELRALPDQNLVEIIGLKFGDVKDVIAAHGKRAQSASTKR